MRIQSICLYMTALVVSIQAAPLPPALDVDLLKTEKEQEATEKTLTVWREDGGGTTAEASYFIGLCFYNGIDVEIDKKMAFGFFRKSAVEGYADAEFMMGIYFLNGEKDIVETNTTAAAQWFAKAAEQKQPKAQLYLGICYRKGVGVKRDDELGVRWIRKAADQNVPKAQFYVGTYYADGIVYEKNPAEALKWFKLAAEQDYAEAQYRVGACYYNGIGVEKNREEALKWFRLAAKNGDTMAIEVLEKLGKAASPGK
jgi:TPR repeat protein